MGKKRKKKNDLDMLVVTLVAFLVLILGLVFTKGTTKENISDKADTSESVHYVIDKKSQVQVGYNNEQ